ncbi:MAG TPA: hypothetical protein VGD67_26780 [Pseudonocardiaceae bacterium]
MTTRLRQPVLLTLLDPLHGVEGERVITDQGTMATAPYLPGVTLLDELRAAVARRLARDGVHPDTSPLPLDATLGVGRDAVTIEPLRLVCVENAWRLPRDAGDLPHANRPAATFLDGYTTLLPGSVLVTYLTTPATLTADQLTVLLVALDDATPRVGPGRRCHLSRAGGAACLIDLDAVLDPAGVAEARERWDTAHTAGVAPSHLPEADAGDGPEGDQPASPAAGAGFAAPDGWMP